MSLVYRVNKQRHIEQSLVDWRHDRLLVIVYNEQHLPVSFTPARRQALAAVHVAYDVTGHVTWWRRGDVIMTYVYDVESSHLVEWTQTDQLQRLVHRYVYDNNSHVVSSREHSFVLLALAVPAGNHLVASPLSLSLHTPTNPHEKPHSRPISHRIFSIFILYPGFA